MLVSSPMSRNLPFLEVQSCADCPRLRAYCAQVAEIKRAAHSHDHYWGKPVAGFGDPNAELVIVGLAPGAHGANRTGRIFTGDRSGEWLYRALYEADFANQPDSHRRDDGLILKNAYVTCVVKCAPPDNKPTLDEQNHCREKYLVKELESLASAKVYLALGQIALIGLLNALKSTYRVELSNLKNLKFGHGKVIELPNGKSIVMSYHPSQQNTFTKKLTAEMWREIFVTCRNLCELSQKNS